MAWSMAKVRENLAETAGRCKCRGKCSARQVIAIGEKCAGNKEGKVGSARGWHSGTQSGGIREGSIQRAGERNTTVP